MKRQVIGLCVAAVLLTGFKPNSSEKDYAAFRPHMRAIYASLMTVFPLALSKSTFMDKNNAKLIEEKLAHIAEHASMINEIASKDEKGHAYMSYQLERNAQQALLKFKAGYLDQANFFVEELYDTCLGCHTSRSSVSDSEFTLDFTKDVNMEALGTFGKAKFLSLSRQFEKALDEYEQIFSKSGLSLEELLHFDPFVDYLVLAVRVKGEPDRVIKTFQSLVKKNLPVMIKRDLEVWLDALVKIKGKGPQQSDLEYARNLIENAKSSMEYPRDRGGLVYYIFASKYLKDHLKAAHLSAEDRAETYYQLGICELGIGRPILAAESGMYLQEAIRLAPKSAFAKKAFGLYEESVMFGYTGSSGTNLPAHEKAKLEELRKLVL